jgi:epoxyqueuosine reductase
MMKEKLLLHLCWPKASSEVLKCLSNKYEITTYFYNPNVEDEDEFLRRLKEARIVSKLVKDIIENDYLKDSSFEIVSRYKCGEDNCQRCLECYSLRIEKAILKAIDNGYDNVATTLTVIPGKSADLINAIGVDLAKRYGITFIEADFSKISTFKYNYCGCSRTNDK